MADQVTLVRWEEPPPAKAEAGRGRAASKYDNLAALLRSRPGQSALIRETANRNVAAGLAGLIREGRVVCFQPRGDFDACTRTVGGVVRVYARFLGDGEEST